MRGCLDLLSRFLLIFSFFQIVKSLIAYGSVRGNRVHLMYTL